MNIKKISNFSLFCFFLLFTLRQITLATPMLHAKEAGNATWLSSIFVSILAIAFLFLLFILYKKFNDKDIFDIAKFIGDNFLYKLTCIIYFIVFFALTVAFLKEISEAIKLLLFHETPIIFIQLFYILAMLVGSIVGIEAIIRGCGYLIPFSFILLALIILISSSFFNIDNFFPILGTGINSIFLGSLKLLSSYLGILIILFILPHITNNRNKTKIVLIYMLFAFIFSTISLIAITLSFGYPYTNSNLFSFYELANMVNSSNFFRHSEGLYEISSILLGFLFLMALFYLSTYCFKSLITKNKYIEGKSKAKNNYFINILLLITIILLCNFPKNISDTFHLKEFVNLYLVLPFTYIYPLILLIIANLKYYYIRRKNEENIFNSN